MILDLYCLIIVQNFHRFFIISRYKILDKAEQDRKLVLFQHLGFVHCPLREHCPALPNCVDNTVPTALERTLG